MSFKRDGDDPLLLNRLKHKRVSDLLGEHVPENEAKLLSNGRLTCLICHHRPIFDTMNILTIHRKGKKHLEELHKYLAHKQKRDLQEAKRTQYENFKKERELKKHILGPKIARTTPNNFSKKKTIDITSKNPFGISSVPSASSQVRKYLKEISKMTPLSKVVQEQKESYPDPQPALVQTNHIESSNNTAAVLVNKACKVDPTLPLTMSGWIRDKFGNLIKDPEAEFDTSDDDL